MTERSHHDSPADTAASDDPQLRPQSSEDDYSGRDGGTSNAEAVAVGQEDRAEGRTGTAVPVQEDGRVPPQETRSPAPAQPAVPERTGPLPASSEDDRT